MTAWPSLWLDVEKGRDTTEDTGVPATGELWLDVEKGRDTTGRWAILRPGCCGLM